MESTVDEVGRIVRSEGIDCRYAKGGTVTLARTAAQLQRARDEVATAHRRGVGEGGLVLLGPDQASAIVGATGVPGGPTPPTARQSIRHGWCAAWPRRSSVGGWSSMSRPRHRPSGPAWSRLSGGPVRATVVIRATEGYTCRLRGETRTLAPVYSLMIATEPLPDDFWAEAGLRRRETFGDFRHLIVYGQRTADGRMAFGGRGAPYHLGSAIRPGFDQDDRVHESLRSALVELFPALDGAAITHRWGGPLGIARDWFPSVGFDRGREVGWAGGYVGDGVSTANLAGRTLRDLVLQRDTELTALPWVGHRSKRWEPEPLRYLGINAGLRLAASADRSEERAGRATWQTRPSSGCSAADQPMPRKGAP